MSNSENITKPVTDKPRQISQGLKSALEFGPLIAFFVANWWGGIFVATVVIMITTPITLAINWYMTREWAVMPIVTLLFVSVFGGLTLYLHDETFIKVKVTIINGLFSAILLGGLVFRQTLLKHVFGQAMALDEQGWKKLTLRWGLFFLALAGLNEIIWRNVSTDSWVSFKTFGILPLTFVFAFSQLPLMQKHMVPQNDDNEA